MDNKNIEFLQPDELAMKKARMLISRKITKCFNEKKYDVITKLFQTLGISGTNLFKFKYNIPNKFTDDLTEHIEDIEFDKSMVRNPEQLKDKIFTLPTSHVDHPKTTITTAKIKDALLEYIENKNDRKYRRPSETV